MGKTKNIFKLLSLHLKRKKKRQKKTEVTPETTDTGDSGPTPHIDVGVTAVGNTTLETVVQLESSTGVVTTGVPELSSGASYGPGAKGKPSMVADHTEPVTQAESTEGVFAGVSQPSSGSVIRGQKTMAKDHAKSNTPGFPLLVSQRTDEMAEAAPGLSLPEREVSPTIPPMIIAPRLRSDEEEIIKETEAVKRSLSSSDSENLEVGIPMAGAMTSSSSTQMVYYAPGATSTSILAKQVINIHGVEGTHVSFQDPAEMGRRALKLLSKYSNADAELNSAARYPPPRCHPDTRKMLLDATKDWMTNPEHKKRALWLYGTAGVGKSAFAQTLAEYARDNKILGGVYFFSRPNGRSDPNTVFPTIARQLATINEDYKREITTILDATPHVLTCDFKVQFQKLIVEPLRNVHIEVKLLIILDGLDECTGEETQCEIAEIITQLLQVPTDPLPVFWMICSRPEQHLKYLLNAKEVREVCWVEELSVDFWRDNGDTYAYVNSEFQRLKRKYSHIVDIDWPGESQIDRIVNATIGHFASSTAILKFIDDPKRPNPEGLLDIVLQVIDNSNLGHNLARNPMGFLDALYTRILEEIPDDIIQDTLMILYTILWHFNGDVSRHMYIHDVANMLGIDRGRFFAAIGKIHSLVQIPESIPGILLPIAFNHASFHDFLMDPARSGRFAVNYEVIYPILRRRSVEILGSDITVPIHLLEPEERTATSKDLMKVFDRQLLPWKYPPPRIKRIQSTAGKLVKIAVCACLELCSDKEKRKLDFNRLAFHDSYLLPIERLIKLARPIDPNSEIDKKLLELCLSTKFSNAKPLPMTETNEIDETRITDMVDSDGGVYMFLGYGSKAIIGVLTTPWAQGFHFLFPISLYHPGEYWPQYTLLKSIPRKENYGRWGIARYGMVLTAKKARTTPRFDTDSNFVPTCPLGERGWEDYC